MPFLVMIVEIVMLVIMAGCIGLWLTFRISLNTQLQSELLFLVNQISLSEGDLESIYQSLKPNIIQPGVIFLGFAIFSGVIPLIEEILKPIAIWFFANRKISPQEGFVGGLLCGAGFALMENLLYFQMVVTPDEWLFVALGRIGTTALHMLVSGLVGWGLAITWRDGKWIPLMVMTLGAVSLHGFWNAMAMFAGIVPVLMPNITESSWAMIVLNVPLVSLSIATLMGIVLINLHFRRENQFSEAQPNFEG
jgi:RsiW-degrading membrane proteinase PrsW (M82 family)